MLAGLSISCRPNYPDNIVLQFDLGIWVDVINHDFFSILSKDTKLYNFAKIITYWKLRSIRQDIHMILAYYKTQWSKILLYICTTLDTKKPLQCNLNILVLTFVTNELLFIIYVRVRQNKIYYIDYSYYINLKCGIFDVEW